MFETPILRLPLLAAAQAQKHVTHNEALLTLDALVQLAVIDTGLDQPPDTPGEGDAYIAGDAPIGDWTGHAGEIVHWRDGIWNFLQPRNGWRAWDNTGNRLMVFQNGVWQSPADGSSNPNPDQLGINAVADATNRLSVNSQAVLFNRETDNVRVVLNKEAELDTASFVFQQGFNGHAEIGLTGSNHFSFKVSPDGVNFLDGIVIDNATGEVSFPNTPNLTGGGSGPPPPSGGDALQFLGADTDGWAISFLDNSAAYPNGAAPATALDAFSSFTRASTADYTDNAGNPQVAAPDEPRLDHDQTGQPLGLLIQPSGVNLDGSLRAADSAYTLLSALPYNLLEGTFVIEAAYHVLNANHNYLLAVASGISTAHYLAVQRFQTHIRVLSRKSNTTSVDLRSSPQPGAGVIFRAAFACQLNNFALVFTDRSLVEDVTADVPDTLDRLRFGNRYDAVDGQHLNGHLRRVKYVPRRLSNAELESAVIL